MLIPTCRRCHEPYGSDDRFCRSCGHDLRAGRLPEAEPSRAVVEWRGAVPGLLQGMAVAGAGVALRYVLPKVAGMAARRALRLNRGPVAQRTSPAVYVSETHIVRRVWLRR